MNLSEHTAFVKSKLLAAESTIPMLKAQPTLARAQATEGALQQLHAAMLAMLNECGQSAGLTSTEVQTYAGTPKSNA